MTLTDAELLRKVQILIGYNVENNGCFCYLCRYEDDLHYDVTSSEQEAWEQAPDYLHDANAWMVLVKEMWDATPEEDRNDFTLMRNRDTGLWYCEVPDFDANHYADNCDTAGRAVCEAWVNWKEQK